MLKLLEYVYDFFTFIIDLFTLLVKIIGSLIMVLVNCVVFLYDVISALPTFMLIAASVLVIVAVLYKVLGRESQS